MGLLDKIASSLAPHNCLGCGQEGNLLCPACLAKLPLAPRLTGRGLDHLRAATLYQGLAKQLIWKLKSGGAQAAAQVMATAMLPLLEALPEPSANPSRLATQLPKMFIVSVPTVTSRARQRGYDQAQLLGRALARQSRLPWLDCLARSGQFHQIGANRPQRRKQLHAALRVTQQRFVHGAHIILVDDVVTTGATLETATQLLRAAGATNVDALAFAYTPKTSGAK